LEVNKAEFVAVGRASIGTRALQILRFSFLQFLAKNIQNNVKLGFEI
jgi:hypothetical protein